MKKLLLLLALIPFIAYAQNDSIPMKNGKIEYSGVVSAPGKTKNEIYITVKQWISETHKSSKYVIDLDDKDAGIIIIKDNIFLSNVVGKQKKFYNISSFQTIKIEIKDERFKYTFSDFELGYTFMDFWGIHIGKLDAERFFVNDTSPKNEVSARVEALSLLDNKMKGLASELNKFVNSSINGNDNW
jgi:hypothetical protein